MPLRIDEEYRVKKTRKSSVDRLYKRQILSSSSKNTYTKSKNNTKALNRSVVKVTSGSKSYKEVVNHIDYLSRNGKIELRTSDNRILKGKKETYKAKSEMGFQNEKLSYINEGSSKSKQTYNMVFSLKNAEKEETQILLKTVHKVLKEKYPNNFFVYALHEDSEHPHVHVCLNKRDIKKEKNIHMDKKSLQELKHNFSKELIKNHIKVELEPEKRVGNKKEKDIQKYNNKNRKPTGVFELVAHGHAPYLNDPSKQPSYFVAYRTSKNKIVKVWGRDLERAIKESKAEIGDKVKLKRTSASMNSASTWEVHVYEKSKLSLKERIKQEFTKAIIENKERKEELEL